MLRIHKKGFFWDNIIIIFSQLHFGNIMGIYPILGKKIGHEFLSLGKYWTKNWENFVLEKNRNYYFGKILGNIKSSFHLSQFCFGFGKCFSKNGKTLGTELLNVLGFSQI